MKSTVTGLVKKVDGREGYLYTYCHLLLGHDRKLMFLNSLPLLVVITCVGFSLGMQTPTLLHKPTKVAYFIVKNDC